MIGAKLIAKYSGYIARKASANSLPFSEIQDVAFPWFVALVALEFPLSFLPDGKLRLVSMSVVGLVILACLSLVFFDFMRANIRAKKDARARGEDF